MDYKLPLSLAILVLTVFFGLRRPKFGKIRLDHAIGSLIGAGLTIAFGILPVSIATHAFDSLWTSLVTIAALMVITFVIDACGIFEDLSYRLLTACAGNARKLLMWFFYAGSLVGMVFSNDAVVLIFTPMICKLIQKIRLPTWTRENEMPFYFAVLSMANLVGGLIISNPINVVVAHRLDISFVKYAKWMFLPAVACIISTYYLLRHYFAAAIPEQYTIPEHPHRDARTRAFQRWVYVLLLLCLILYLLKAVMVIHTWQILLGISLLASIVYGYYTKQMPWQVRQGIAFDLLIFVYGMFIVATGMRSAGPGQYVEQAIMAIIDQPVHLGFLTSYFSAFSSALINNHATVDFLAWVVNDLHLDKHTIHLLAFSVVIGGDVGPKMLPLGSLAALIWFKKLHRHGIAVKYSTYIKMGIPISLLGILAAQAVLMLQSVLF